MHYPSLLSADTNRGENREKEFEEENPLVREIKIPGLFDSLRQDIGYHLLAGLIFGAGHYLGLRVMRTFLD